MGVFAGTERQCAEDEHDSQISEFGFKHSLLPRLNPEINRRRRSVAMQAWLIISLIIGTRMVISYQ